MYKLTGCIYNGEEKKTNDDLVYFNELDYEIIKANVSLEYWKEEYDVAHAVKEYAEGTDSKTETDETTQTNLENAIGAYETALSDYEKAVEELVSYKSKVDIAQTEVDTKYAELSKAKGTLEEAKNAYSEILVVYLGVESTPLKEKINSLIVEYEKKKSQSDEEEFKAYYNALVEYTQSNQKQKYLEMKKTIENGTAGGSLLATHRPERTARQTAHHTLREGPRPPAAPAPRAKSHNALDASRLPRQTTTTAFAPRCRLPCRLRFPPQYRKSAPLSPRKTPPRERRRTESHIISI